MISLGRCTIRGVRLHVCLSTRGASEPQRGGEESNRSGGYGTGGNDVGGAIHLTYPGHHSPVEAGQLGVVIGNLLFDNPVERTDKHTCNAHTQTHTQRERERKRDNESTLGTQLLA